MTENNKDIIDGRKEEENKSITLRDMLEQERFEDPGRGEIKEQ